MGFSIGIPSSVSALEGTGVCAAGGGAGACWPAACLRQSLAWLAAPARRASMRQITTAQRASDTTPSDRFIDKEVVVPQEVKSFMVEILQLLHGESLGSDEHGQRSQHIRQCNERRLLK